MAAVVAAGLLYAGAPRWAPAAVLVASWNPVAGVLVAGAIPALRRVRARRRPAAGPAAEAAYFAAVAAELRAGASLRVAVAEAAARVPSLDLQPLVRRALAGSPFETIEPFVATVFAANGRVAPAAFEVAAVTGGRAAELFDALAARAAHAAELSRERRALTAQARLSVLVVGVGPVLVALVLLAAGRAGPLLSHGGAGIAVAAVGLGLEAAGIAVAAAMLRRVRLRPT